MRTRKIGKPKKVALLTEVLSYFDTQNDVDISLVEVGDCTQGEMQVIQARFSKFTVQFTEQATFQSNCGV